MGLLPIVLNEENLYNPLLIQFGGALKSRTRKAEAIVAATYSVAGTNREEYLYGNPKKASRDVKRRLTGLYMGKLHRLALVLAEGMDVKPVTQALNDLLALLEDFEIKQTDFLKMEGAFAGKKWVNKVKGGRGDGYSFGSIYLPWTTLIASPKELEPLRARGYEFRRVGAEMGLPARLAPGEIMEAKQPGIVAIVTEAKTAIPRGKKLPSYCDQKKWPGAGVAIGVSWQNQGIYGLVRKLFGQAPHEKSPDNTKVFRSNCTVFIEKHEKAPVHVDLDMDKVWVLKQDALLLKRKGRQGRRIRRD